MPPLTYELSDEEAMETIAQVIASRPRARVVEREPLYLHAEFTSLVFRFVDDVELILDPGTRRIDFRSASRTGYSDLGVNRRRMETLCRRLTERAGIAVAGSTESTNERR